MACPATRFTAREIEPDLPLVLPPALDGLGSPAMFGQDADEDAEPTTPTPVLQRVTALAIEVDRIVPPSGNLWLAGRQQIWLGPIRASQQVSLWADLSVVHVSYQGTRLKTLPSRLSTADLHALLTRDARPAGPAPITTGTARAGGPIEVDRLINATGLLSLGGRQFPIGYQWAGQRVTVRLDGALMQISSNGTLLRSMPTPFTLDERTRIRDARPAGPPPRPAATPLRVERRVEHGGVLVIATQRIRVGKIHAGATLTVEVSDTTFRIFDGPQLLTTATRTTSKEVARFKARKPQPALRSARGH
jgi:hypothetical protein